MWEAAGRKNSTNAAQMLGNHKKVRWTILRYFARRGWSCRLERWASHAVASAATVQLPALRLNQIGAAQIRMKIKRNAMTAASLIPIKSRYAASPSENTNPKKRNTSSEMNSKNFLNRRKLVSMARNYGASLDGKQPAISIDTVVRKKFQRSAMQTGVMNLIYYALRSPLAPHLCVIFFLCFFRRLASSYNLSHVRPRPNPKALAPPPHPLH